jgi:hypothetical protein
MSGAAIQFDTSVFTRISGQLDRVLVGLARPRDLNELIDAAVKSQTRRRIAKGGPSPEFPRRPRG